ncbi:Flagellar M-ring protein [Buchnera aphidicola (Cinara piceae)]|uniref:Flagellar M-ring protein n=1 Tax=Buchnera aphidicola (Cinara piceae) TaxID=1660043 RepID=A0A803FTC4_9GAMM|nr:flagellar basal-body MS-ring/collar protein FliF [Buchnera aphidicola]VFP87864.1 Flagellar M-ring protein [Buchnera aphidicola (Cinara piceae)]
MNFISMFFLNMKKKWNNFLIYFFNKIKFFIFILFCSFCIFFSVFFWSRKVNYVVLYTNLSDADGRWVISKLKNMHISYQFYNSSRTLLVPEDKLSELRFSLLKNNIIKKNHGFELLDKEKFGISQFHEHINYHRGLEGELSQTLERIFPIQHARVHLVCTKDTDFFRDEQVPSASIVVTLFPNTSLTQEQIDAIILLISGSVPNLSPNHIVLVDQFGNILNKFNLNNTKFFNHKQYKNISILEEYYRDRINKILIPIYGLKNFVVHVKINREYKNIPVNDSPIKNINILKPKLKKSLNNVSNILSYQYNRNNKFIMKNDFLSKLFLMNYIHNILLNQNNLSSNLKNNKLDLNLVYRDDNISFLGFKKSDIKNLTITILINYKKNSSGILLPLSKAELKDVEKIIKLAIDFSSNRGDHIKIMNYIFSDSSDALNFQNNFIYKNFNQYYKIYIFFGILITILFFCFLFIKKIFISNKKDFLNSSNSISKCKKNNFQNHTNISDLDKSNDQNKNDFFVKKDILQKNPKIIEKVIRYWINKK